MRACFTYLVIIIAIISFFGCGSQLFEKTGQYTVTSRLDQDLSPVFRPVQSQGPVGSCQSYAVTGWLEHHFYLKNHKLIDLSEKYLMYHYLRYQIVEGDRTPDIGAYVYNIFDVVLRVGVIPESMYAMGEWRSDGSEYKTLNLNLSVFDKYFTGKADTKGLNAEEAKILLLDKLDEAFITPPPKKIHVKLKSGFRTENDTEKKYVTPREFFSNEFGIDRSNIRIYYNADYGNYKNTAVGHFQVNYQWGMISETVPIDIISRKIKDELDRHHPVLVSFYTEDSYWGSSSGNLKFRESSGHAVMVVGWDEASKTFKLRNSWGKNRGKKGYYFVKESELKGQLKTIAIYEKRVYDRQGPGKFMTSLKAGMLIAPTVKKDVIFAADSVGNVYRIEKGSITNQTDLGNGVSAVMTEKDDKLYVSTFDRKIYSLNAKKLSEKKWEFQAPNLLLGAAMVVGDHVIFGCANHYVYALGVADGKLKWKYKASNWVQVDPVMYNGMVMFNTDDGYILGLDPATGDKKFKSKKLADWIISNPVIDGDTMLVSLHLWDSSKRSRETFVIYDLKKNEIVKKRSYGRGSRTPPVILGEQVLTIGRDGIISINYKTGLTTTSFKVPVLKRPVMTKLGDRAYVAIEGNLFVMNEYTHLKDLKAYDSDIIGLHAETKGTDKVLYVSTENGNIYKLEL